MQIRFDKAMAFVIDFASPPSDNLNTAVNLMLPAHQDHV